MAEVVEAEMKPRLYTLEDVIEAVNQLRQKTRSLQDAVRDLSTRLIDVEHFLARLALPTVPTPPTLPEYFPRGSRWVLELFPDEISQWREALRRISREPLTERERSFLRSMDYYLASERKLTIPQLAWLQAIIRKAGAKLPEVPMPARGGSHSTRKLRLSEDYWRKVW
jgi:hypothetical protein